MESKKKFPYYYEYHLRGGGKTVEGSKYGIRHREKLLVEYHERADIEVARILDFGGSKKIHMNSESV